MKKNIFSPGIALRSLTLGVWMWWLTWPALALETQPTIRSIHLDGNTVVISVHVPTGLRKVTLESRRRAEQGSWEPRALTRSDGTGGELSFRLPAAKSMEIIRVRGDATDPLPASFYAGTNSFENQGGATQGPMVPGQTDTPAGTFPGPVTGGAQSRAVVESDIWKIRDQTLYFFNQYRGLQLIDVTHPDAAVVRGTVDLPAAGEDMYLLGLHHVILLASGGCSDPRGGSQVVIVEDKVGGPEVVTRLPVQGYLQESRLVGTALYVASQTYRVLNNGTGTTWESGTVVSAFDLADPSTPVAREPIWYPGYGSVVMANDQFLCVVTQDPANWWQSTVQILDISSPDGQIRTIGSVPTAGRVADKFKMNLDGDVFAVVSEDWHWDGGSRLVTKLETFRLPASGAAVTSPIVKLGELELGRGERLHATRFDGSRVYVVTFFQIDPLWVVDLSDPKRPRISGQLEVPGWSTYIQPLGDQLVALGVETNRVTLSLFDVKDPAHPGLLSKVRLGENYSWSEASYNEKALTILPADGLILVPYSGDTKNGYASRVQLVDLRPSSLELRGLIEHSLQPRRATLYQNRILSFSGLKLSSVDATDRDHPQVTGETDLAWSVDRLLVEGDYLVEIPSLYTWGTEANPVLRTAPVSDPDRVAGLLTIKNLPIVGATKQGSRLYLAQAASPLYPWLVPLATDAPAEDITTLLLTIVNLEHLPALQIESQVEAKISSLSYGSSDFQPVWPKPGCLVWVGGGSSFGFWLDGPAMGQAMDAVPGGLFRPWPRFWGSSGGQLIAFDVHDPAAPKFASEVKLPQDNWWSFSRAFTAGGLIYLSHQTSQIWWAPPLPLSSASAAAPAQDPADGTGTKTAILPDPIWVQRSFLDVVDYADAKSPLVREPVNVPGTLQGISHEGALLYTVGTHWRPDHADDWTEYLEASAYDGTAAHLVDSLALSNVWPRPLLVLGTNIFLGHPGYSYVTTDTEPHTLEIWTLPETGRFTRTAKVPLALPAVSLASVPGLLLAQESDNTIVPFDLAMPPALEIRGEGRPPGCLSMDLSNADGDAARGVWAPLGAYGVAAIPVKR